MKLTPIVYEELNSKQKEIYNFQKVAAKLAEYGFNCMKLTDDWQGADFLAYHKDGDHTLKVQLKSRLTIARKYANKDLYVAFPVKQQWYLMEHDLLIEEIAAHTPWLTTQSWLTEGLYSTIKPNQALLDAIKEFML